MHATTLVPRENGRNHDNDYRPSWRPQDPAQTEYRGWRDDDRDESWRSSERYGQGQSGYHAGRGELDRSLAQQTRNQAYGHEDRRHEPYTDDRFTGRGGPSYWTDRSERTGYPRGNEGGHRREQSWERPEPEWRPEVRRGGGHRGKGPVNYVRSDDRIRENICEALTDDDAIDASEIEVIVHDGEVTLTGIVDDRETKRAAEDCVWHVGGVKDVQNQLRLRPRGNPAGSGEVTKHEIAESRPERKHRA